MTKPFQYPERPFDRGKVLSAEEIEKLHGDWGRYRDVDGDGVTYRTLPGTDHAQAGYFTRGSGHDEQARYTESAEAYARNMDRLARKHETARAALPEPVVDEAGRPVGLIAFGSTDVAVAEARDRLREQGLEVDYLRVRALPLHESIKAYVDAHERVYVIEQNRDGQLYDLLRVFLPVEVTGRLRSIRYYDGQPIPAEAITRPLAELEAVPA
jgi:2-oxoglutarate ferredoxin oxidoreductase subunit alpha